MSPHESEIEKIGGLSARDIARMDEIVEAKLREHVATTIRPILDENVQIRYALEDLVGNPSKQKEGLVRSLFRELNTKMDAMTQIQTGQHQEQTKQLTKQDERFAEFAKKSEERHEENRAIVARVEHVEEWITRDDKDKQNYHVLYELLSAFAFFFTTGKGLWIFLLKVAEVAQRTWLLLMLIIALIGGLWANIFYNRTHPPAVSRPAYITAPPANPPVAPLPLKELPK